METYTTPQLESGEGLSVGDRVESRRDLLAEDYDEGYVLAIDDRQITVGWDSGVMTTQDISQLETDMTTYKTIDQINQVAAGNNVSGTTIYWDSQDPSNAGPAYRDGQDSGKLELVGWGGGSGCDGYEIEHYFDGDGAYLGPDVDGVYPVFSM